MQFLSMFMQQKDYKINPISLTYFPKLNNLTDEEEYNELT